MIIEKHEISRLKFKILSLNSNDIERYACKKAISAGYHPAGYGCFNPKITAENGKTYIQWRRLSSCE